MELVKAASKHCHIRSVIRWTDSTLVLHWLKKQGLCKKFVANRGSKILEKEYIKRYYILIKQNSADIGSRVSLLSKIADIWWKGASWIAELNKWPDQAILSESKKSEKEIKIIENILAATVQQKGLFDFLIDKHELHILRLSAWITRFINNCEQIKKRGSLIISEMQCQKKFYIKPEKRKVEHSEKGINREGIYECRGKIQGVWPILLPSSSALSEKIVTSAHRKSLHGGVASTMAAVRSLFQTPVLIKLTKSVIQNCYGCKRFRATHYPNPKIGPLPIDWKEQIQPFEIIVTDYAGPL